MLVRHTLVALFVLPLLVLPLRMPLDAAAPAETRLLRTPTVSATSIAFTYAQNIWIADRAGGIARRLTSLPGGTDDPHFSPDGSMIAFSAAYSGNTDVYVVPAAGGEPKRLTWHPGGDSVQGWTPDGKKILFTSGRATSAPGNAPRFWTVPVEGGVEEPLPIPRGYQGSISPDGKRIAYRLNTSWDEERRNYRGGQNKAIWLVDLDDFDLETVPWKPNEGSRPGVARLVGLLDLGPRRRGQCLGLDTTNKLVRQMTRFRDYDVKSIDAGAGVVVFSSRPATSTRSIPVVQTKRLAISVVGDFPWMMPRWEDVSSRISNMALSPTGKRALFEARGEIFTVPVENGDVRNLTRSSGSAEKNPAWSARRQMGVVLQRRVRRVRADDCGPGRPVGAAQDRPAEADAVLHRVVVPDSKKLLYSDTDVKVWVLDVETGQAKIVGQEMWMVPTRTLNPVWSPDSTWVAYSARLKSMYHAIFATNVETLQTVQVTDGLADAQWPAWDASGKYLLVLRVDRLRLDVAVARHDALSVHGELRPVLRDSEERRAHAAPAQE